MQNPFQIRLDKNSSPFYLIYLNFLQTYLMMCTLVIIMMLGCVYKQNWMVAMPFGLNRIVSVQRQKGLSVQGDIIGKTLVRLYKVLLSKILFYIPFL